MAYVLPQLDDEEEKQKQAQQAQQPTLGGGAPSFGGGGGALATQQDTPKAQNVTQRGTGFTNLQSWLDAGKGRDANIGRTGSGLLSTEKDTFGKASSTATGEADKFKVKTVDDVNGTGVGDVFGGKLKTAANGDEAAKTEIKGMLDQDYKGPMSIDYNAADRKNLWDVGALTDASTASSVLAKPAMDAGQYGSGMQRLDSVLFGSDAASRAALDTNKKDLGDFTKKVGTDSKAFTERAAGLKDAAAKAREGARAELGRQGSRMLESVDQRVADLKRKDEERQTAIDQGFAIDPVTGKAVRAGPGFTVGETRGGNASRGTVVNDQEKRGFDLLHELIGTPTVQKTGTYEQLSKSMTKDPGYEGVDPWTGRDMRELKAEGYGTSGWLQKMSGFNAEKDPNNVYQRAISEGLSPEQASAVRFAWLDSMGRQFPDLATGSTKEQRAEWRKLLAGTRYAGLMAQD